jgi:hypothetical protein
MEETVHIYRYSNQALLTLHNDELVLPASTTVLFKINQGVPESRITCFLRLFAGLEFMPVRQTTVLQ